MVKKKRKADVALDANYDYIYGIVTEILCWSSCIIGLDRSVDDIMIKEKVDMKRSKDEFTILYKRIQSQKDL